MLSYCREKYRENDQLKCYASLLQITKKYKENYKYGNDVSSSIASHALESLFEIILLRDVHIDGSERRYHLGKR